MDVGEDHSYFQTVVLPLKVGAGTLTPQAGHYKSWISEKG